MLTKKIDLVRNEGYSLYSTALVPDINDNLIEYLSLLKQKKIYSMTLEYNTLMKSKKYYLEVNSNNKYDLTNNHLRFDKKGIYQQASYVFYPFYFTIKRLKAIYVTLSQITGYMNSL